MMCNGALCNGVERIIWDVWKPPRGKWWRVVQKLNRYDGTLWQFLKEGPRGRRWLLLPDRASKFATKKQAELALTKMGRGTYETEGA